MAELSENDVIRLAAQVAHEANRAFAITQGDNSQKHWEDADKHQVVSSIAGVASALKGATPEQQHKAWMDAKAADGWKYGPEKDPTAKTHPSMVPYDELPKSEQIKDSLYTNVIKAVVKAVEDHND